MKQKGFRTVILWITYAVLLVFVLININSIWGVASNFFGIITPFLYGFLLAYLLNFPYTFFKDKAFKKMGAKRKIWGKFRSPLALILTYIFGIGVIAFLLGILLPQLGKSVENLVSNFSGYADTFKTVEQDAINWVNNQFGLKLDNQTILDTILNHILSIKPGDDITKSIGEFISTAFPAAFNTAKLFTINIYNWIIAIIVSVYFLLGKDKLCSQAKKIAFAYLPEKVFNKTQEIIHLSNNMCGKFIVGKIIDSTIIGVICFICLSIFQFDYALLISVIVGVTNVIPFFGPFIGAIPSAFLLLIIDPVQCFWFVIFIIILQQIDGNIIGPKILGNSVGVSGIWIMVSVIIGGGLFGVAGMVLGVPVFAVIYTLISKNVYTRIRKKKTAADLPVENKDTFTEVREAVTTDESEPNS